MEDVFACRANRAIARQHLSSAHRGAVVSAFFPLASSASPRAACEAIDEDGAASMGALGFDGTHARRQSEKERRTK